jgi:hypothetical protein
MRTNGCGGKMPAPKAGGLTDNPITSARIIQTIWEWANDCLWVILQDNPYTPAHKFTIAKSEMVGNSLSDLAAEF